MKRIRIIAAALLLLPALATRVCAWESEGHIVVGYIAEQHLTEKARTGIRELLGPDLKISDDTVASWPDHIRNNRPETKPWHYVDVPFDAAGYDPQRDCHDGQCVAVQTEHFAKVLGDPNATMVSHGEALRFLVHFVGDLHQPLHCAEQNGDKGGNLVKVTFLSRPEVMNLHWVWDTWLIRSYLGDANVLQYAARLDARITPPEQAEWERGTVADWVSESHRAAVEHTYAGVPIQSAPVHLGTDYVTGNQPLVEEQLMKAGIRLAVMLNNAFP